MTHYFLPYGMLRGVFPTARFPLGGRDFLGIFSRIFLFNLAVAVGFIVALNLFSVKSIPLGYFLPLIQICLYGIFLGTDSFAVSHGSKFLPSLTIVGQAGFYEFTAYILIAAATSRITLWNQTDWLGGGLTRVKKRSEINLSHLEISIVVLGVFLLLMAAVKETTDILRVI